ncbi:MAG TPA: enoyl-CoA hydratase-related protein [Alcanivoracaceae bacterium]|nr:enoyl-CoA hydratase-related protein [Alcanivoracaceae bacterium]
MSNISLKSGLIRVTQQAPLLIVTLARPEKLNALTVDMYKDLYTVTRFFDREDQFSTMLINADGNAFCAGNDINDFLNATPESRKDGKLSPAMDFVLALASTDKTVIAAVQGNATGIGTTMLLHTDLVIASEDALLHTAFIQLGLVPEAGSSLLLPQLVGKQNAARLLIAGDRLTAQEAKEMGLIAYVAPTAELQEAALELANKVANYFPEALKATKALMKIPHQKLEERIAKESVLFAERMFSEETQALFKRFVTKK